MKLKFLSRGSDRRFDVLPSSWRTTLNLSALMAMAFAPLAHAQQVGFNASLLKWPAGAANNKAKDVSSLQFGPDNRLYFTQVNGTVIACDVTRLGPNDYHAANAETINLVKLIPNHDDDGTYNPAPLMENGDLGFRQCTGLLVTGTAANPVVYVSSCDPRQGAGSGGTDFDLDTNSGIVSRLTKNASTGEWEKVDVVRGLPRSEENHANNGLTISADGNTLYLAQGGNTNAGAPSANFAYCAEYALSAAILSIDLVAINALPVQTDMHGQKYLYNLPTLNDPNPDRAHNGDGSDVNDPFGGNDGLNQAKLVQGGPVQVYASGFRNPYDVLIATTPGHVGKMYTFDNAANQGWGGYPKNEAVPATVTNEYVAGEPGTVNNKDGLYLISGPGYYRGHPSPIRANPAGAGWFWKVEDGPGAGLQFSAAPTTDWPPVPVSMADPQQGDFLMPGPLDGALITNTFSTTGLTEYTAPNFGGEMIGDILATQYNNQALQRIMMNGDGTVAENSSLLLKGTGYGTPLDVTCPGPGAAPTLWGTIFIGHHSSKISILEPTDFDSPGGGVCSGVFSFALDEDNDGYSNADEVSNNVDPCSPAVTPDDHDGDFLSNLLDSDDDNDGIVDTQDVFPIDALNGRSVSAPVNLDLFNDNEDLGGFFELGLRGVMLNPGQNYAAKMHVDDLIAGGTGGLFTDPFPGPGNPHGTSNTQLNGYLFGVSVDEFTGPVIASSKIGTPLFNSAPTAHQSQGMFIGNGDQDNYVKVAFNANNGAGGVEVVHEENGVILTQVIHPAPGLFAPGVLDVFAYCLVDPIAGTVHPGYSLNNGPITYVGSPLVVSGKILGAIRGSSAMALGMLATTGTVETPTFEATWDYLDVAPVTNTASAKLTISGAGTLSSSSTNTGGSFRLENNSTGGQKITSLSIDLRTGMMPDVVFDPAHTAGDHDGKAFQVDANAPEDLPAPTGTATHTFAAPHNGVDSGDGYGAITVDCSGLDFPAGRLLKFSSDIDPLSIKMTPTPVTGPGPFEAGSISGLEIVGATVTVTFDDGTVRKSRLGGLPGTSNANKGSGSDLSPAQLPTPSISVAGQASPFTTTTQPTVRVVGKPGATVQVGVFRSALRLTGHEPMYTVPGYQIDPYETNRVESYDYSEVTIGANGLVDMPLSLNYDEVLGGIHMVTAFLTDLNGHRSASSNVLTIEYDPTATPPNALFRINTGSNTSYTDTADQVWAADANTSTYNSTSGSVDTSALTAETPIAGTEDDVLYRTFRYDSSASSPLDFNFTVPNGDYEVRLHFAETWSGVTAVGQRVFDVLLEGNTAVNDLDVFAEAGSNAVLVKTLETTVNDGLLTLGLRHEVQNPFVCGIEILQLNVTGPDEEAPEPPALLTHSNLQSGSVQLAWSQASDNSGSIAGYRIYRDSLLAPLVETTSQSYQVTGLMPATEYTFGVEAFDAAGNVSTRTTLVLTTAADTQDPSAPGTLKGAPGNELAILSWLAATDDTRIQEYRISRDGNPPTTVTGLGYTDTGLTNGTLYEYSVVAVDVVGKLSSAVTVSVRPRALGPAIYRVDCGNVTGNYTDLDGRVWTVDTGYNPTANAVGPTPTTTVAISGTNAQEVYRTYRYKNRNSGVGTPMKYEFTLPNGQYELRLHFAELWTGATTPGARVFNVAVEGEPTFTNFDIFVEAGLNAALVKAIPVTVADGKMNIDFAVVTQNPQISGIEIFPLQEGPPDTTPPDAPANLVVSSKTDTSVSLAWDAPTDDATAWEVSQGSEVLGIVTATSYTITGLTPNTGYTYSVRARDAANNYSTPATLNVTTDPDTSPPSAPQNLTATPGNGIVILGWQAPTGEPVDHYQILRDEVELTTVTTPGFTDSTVTNGTTYVYKVKAVDAADNASAAATASTTPQSLGPAIYRINCGKLDGSHTDPGGNVWAADAPPYYNNNDTGTSSVTVTGTTAPEIYKTHRYKNRFSGVGTPLRYQLPVTNGIYEVRLHFAEVWTQAALGKRVFDVSLEGTLVLNDFDIFAEVGSNTALVKALPTSVSDGLLTIDLAVVVQNPQICAIEVYPVASGGSGTGDTVAPGTPGSPVAANLTQTSVDLSWSASTDNEGGSGVTGYHVFRRIPATQPVEEAQLIATVTGTSFADSGLAPATGYEYRVVAYDGANNASDPAILPVTTVTPDTTAPTSPNNLAATPSLGQVALSWQASSDIGGSGVKEYVVRRDSIEIATVTTPGYTDTGLIGNISVVYEVKAVDFAGNSSEFASTEATTPPDAEAPGAPRNLTAVPGNGSITFSWQAPLATNDVSSYQIWHNGSQVTTVGSPEYVATGLQNGQLYTYEVRTVDTSTNVSSYATASATPRALAGPAVRVNVGGGEYTDSLGNVWVEDSGFFNMGQTATNGSIPIAGTEEDSLYRSERYDGSPDGADLEFSTDVANGRYEVKLHFAETYNQITAAGQRVFDVYAQEQLAIDNLDIFDRVGLNAALVMVIPVTVTDGSLDIRFDHLDIQNPKICAIEVLAIVPPAPATFAEWLTSNNLPGQTTGDADGGGLSNLEEYELQLNPNDPNDDLEFRVTCTTEGASKLIALPALKPIGNYYVHRSDDLGDLDNVTNRIDTITKAEIEAMSPAERASYTIEDNTGGTRAFYQLFFVPVAE
ncbi:malectin domain-containing carbohydrate-binding protein [Luteolibacter arcticus]|uniref:Malectin domain-containing carbohydrate-binding protein n=1 Tax=Luteolibacter arcticus TaxID=1581411 RepID=A0ABT3GH08_9BACT|nr:malectin domain-containing carbohydrate-binding protein [Luteolibacter arcticus]MCW1922902.1 malectin domain-containing carbohydrate-binding protein [Luteolibacter arcticus]